MNLAAALLAGAGAGLGVVLLVRAMRGGRPSLAAALADLHRPRTSIDLASSRNASGLVDRATRILEYSGLIDTAGLRRRLRILNTTVEQHLFSKITVGITGLLAPLLVAGVAASVGITVPGLFVVVGSVGCAAVGFVLPDIGLADRIERRRRAFRHALSAYLDLVTIILAGGGGLETALHAAAAAGDGWAFDEIRYALRSTRFTGHTPWDSFADLGEQLGVDELTELAAAAHLAGDQGARIRASLAAKADTLRAHQTAAIEAQAEAATEKMLVPVVGLVVGMILFIGFGVVEAISTPDPTTLTPP